MQYMKIIHKWVLHELPFVGLFEVRNNPWVQLFNRL